MCNVGRGAADYMMTDRGFSVREQLPLPKEPPYTAHLGNLSFDVTEGDVEDFFSGCEVSSVRIVEDKIERKPKGFGYVEFRSLEGLKQALTKNETSFQGRNIRISVADPRMLDGLIECTKYNADILSSEGSPANARDHGLVT